MRLFISGDKINCRDGCDGHNSSHSVFIEGDTVFSYGYHYPLAIRVGVNKYLVNGSGYSNSTAKHTNHFYSATSYSETLEVPTIAMKAWKNGDKGIFEAVSLKYYGDLVSSWKIKAEKAKKDHTREYYNQERKQAEDNIESVKEWANLENNNKPKIDNTLAMTAMVAKMGALFSTQKESNDWKARMLKAGLENRGLIMPEDWDELSEEEKEKRLNSAIEAIS